MNPIRSLGLWVRQADAVQRTLAALSIAIAVAVIVWAALPAGTHKANGNTAVGASGGTTQTGAGGATGTGQAGSGASAGEVGSGAATGGGSAGSGDATATGQSSSGGSATGSASQTSGGSSAGTGTTSSGGCKSLPGSDQGVTSTQIKIAVTLLNVEGAVGNSTFGIPPPQQQQQSAQAMVDEINSSGGLSCHKLVPQYFDINDADPSNLQEQCIAIVQAGVFAVIDGAYAQFTQKDCFGQNHIPFFGNYYMAKAELQQYYPYFFDDSTLEALYREGPEGLAAYGAWTPAKGFKKLGVPYIDCISDLYPETVQLLNQEGVQNSQIVPFDYGCPADLLVAPSAIEQSVVTFQGKGVTNVYPINIPGDFGNFTSVAQQQGYHPIYDLTDDGICAGVYGSASLRPNFQNISNSVCVSNYGFGAEQTPGIGSNSGLWTAGDKECNASLQKAFGAGANDYTDYSKTYAGYCNQFLMFSDAVEHAPALERTALAAGLESSGSVSLAFPLIGPNNFSGTGVTVVGQSYRVVKFHTDCNSADNPNGTGNICWLPVNPNWSWDSPLNS